MFHDFCEDPKADRGLKLNWFNKWVTEKKYMMWEGFRKVFLKIVCLLPPKMTKSIMTQVLKLCILWLYHLLQECWYDWHVEVLILLKYYVSQGGEWPCLIDCRSSFIFIFDQHLYWHLWDDCFKMLRSEVIRLQKICKVDSNHSRAWTYFIWNQNKHQIRG